MSIHSTSRNASRTRCALAFVLVSSLPLTLAGCDDGPLEEAAEEVDEAVDDVGDAAEDAVE